MQFQAGNKFWLARSSHGRNPIFKDAEQLREACYEYFQWVENNPLYEEKIFHSQGVITKDTIAKMRAMTIGGLCVFLDIDRTTWENYRNNPDFFRITKEVEEIIYNQKFTGAAADLLNANIIARELGLSDKVQNEHTGANGTALIPSAKQMTTDELKAELEALGVKF